MNEAAIFPIGKFKKTEVISEGIVKIMINDIAQISADLRKVVSTFSKKNLHLSYRDGGWSAIQIVHHLADAHCNMYIRVKLALTEELPTVKPYDENSWAEQKEAVSEYLEGSLKMIEGIHDRLSKTFYSMSFEDFNRCYYHPEYDRNVPLTEVLSYCQWHGRHHTAQLRVISQL